MLFIGKRLNGGGGGGKSGAAPPAAPAAAPAPVVAEDTGPDPEMQAEIEKQRAQRYQAGKMGANSEGTGEGVTLEEPAGKTTTILGSST